MQLEREHFAVNLSIGLSKLVPKERRRCVCAGIIAIIGLLFLIAALITNSIYNSLVSRYVPTFEEFRASKNSPKVEAWQNYYGAEFYIKFYMYNITNVNSLGWWQPMTQPTWKEIGPYVYREKRERVVVKSRGTANSDQVEYRIKRTIGEFVPHLSIGSDSEVITLPFVPTMHQGREKNFYTTSIKSWLWGFSGHDDIYFGFYKDLNNIQDLYKIRVSPTSSFGQIDSYNDKEQLPYWYSEEANAIAGTDGTFFTPYSSIFSIPSRRQHMSIFDPDFCRSLQLFHKQTLMYKGIVVHRYAPPIGTFFDDSPINEGFCKNKKDHREDKEIKMTFCYGNYRIMDVRKCNKGLPYGMSWPHFLYDHPHYRKKMRGISDGIEENHETYIDIQPDTGIPLRIVRRSQLNLLWREYESSPLVFFVKGYPTARMVFPLFWTESGYETLPQSEIDQLSLITPVSVVSTSCYIISIFMLLGVVLVLRGRLGFCVISGILWGDDEENILSDQNLKGEGKSDFGDKEEIPLN